MKCKHQWQIDSSLTFLNHGCFGSVPRVVSEFQNNLRDQLENDPIRFLAPERELEQKLDEVRRCIGRLAGADPNNLVFVRNSTDGVNAVLQSLRLDPGDEIVITNHGYNACNNVARFIAKRFSAKVRIAEIAYPIQGPEQVIDSVRSQMNRRTKLLLVDHVTSPSAIIFPVTGLIELAKSYGSKIMVDGAHATGMVPLHLEDWAPDYYTANHHKWLCAPKASGFLYVRPELQESVHPTVISHPYNTERPGRTRFTASFDWVGTHDPTPILAIPAALEFLKSLHGDEIDGLLRSNHEALLEARDLLCDEMGIDSPAPDSMLGSMLSIPIKGLPVEQAPQLADRLRQQFRIEVPVYGGLKDAENRSLGTSLMRISIQSYNDRGDVEKLVSALRKLTVI